MMNFFFFFYMLIIFSQGLSAGEVNKLSVNGTATVYKPADNLNIIIGVETYGQGVKQAIEENKVKMNAVIAALLKAGLPEKEIQTKNFTILPQLTPAPKNLPEDWQPSIAGYQVKNLLDIRTKKLDLIGNLMDAAAAVGVNLVESISFSLLDEEAAKVEAIGKALHQAESYAQAAAESAGIQLENIIELSLNSPYASPQVFRANRLAQEMATPISPREVEVTASVSVSYGIGTKKH
jgi:uncharacterized protein YggE